MQKNDFSSSDFFRTCLDCFQSMKPSLATTLTSCTRGVIVKGQTTGNQENDIVTDPIRCRKSPLPEFESPTFKPEVQHPDHYATGTLPSRNFAFSFSFFALAAKGWV